MKSIQKQIHKNLLSIGACLIVILGLFTFFGFSTEKNDDLVITVHAAGLPFCPNYKGYTCVDTGRYAWKDVGTYDFNQSNCGGQTDQRQYFYTCADVKADIAAGNCSGNCQGPFYWYENNAIAKTCTSGDGKSIQCGRCDFVVSASGFCDLNPGGPSAGNGPTLTLTASPTTVTSGSSSTLTWTVSNATSCTASGGWTGNKTATGGTESTGPLSSNKTYTLNCSNSNGSASASATVSVGSTPGSPSGTMNLTATPVSGTVPLNNVDIAFDAAVTNGCGAQTDPASDRCKIDYRVDCTSDGTWDGATLSYYDAWNKDWDRTAPNRCSYSTAGTHWVTGEMTITKNSDSTKKTVITKQEDIHVYPAVTATCAPSSRNVSINSPASFTCSVTGQTPLTCTWSAPGGSPSSQSGSCTTSTTFNTSYPTESLNNPVTLTVTAPNGNATKNMTVSAEDTNGGGGGGGNGGGGGGGSVTPSHTLMVERNGQGTVRSLLPTPNEIYCGSGCSKDYSDGTEVTLHATPAAGWKLVEWGGACAGTPTNQDCTLTISGDQTVTVKFRPEVIYEEF